MAFFLVTLTKTLLVFKRIELLGVVAYVQFIKVKYIFPLTPAEHCGKIFPWGPREQEFCSGFYSMCAPIVLA